MERIREKNMVQIIIIRPIGVLNIGQFLMVEIETAERWIRYGYARKA
jgi:hypothetical protein